MRKAEAKYGTHKGIANLITIQRFYELVRNKGPYDLKNLPDWQKEHFIYNGEIINKDVPGNISYGYLGKAMEIPDEILIKAAGYAQQQAGTSSPEWVRLEGFGDDPRDTTRIKQGISIYDEWHKGPFDWLLELLK